MQRQNMPSTPEDWQHLLSEDGELLQRIAPGPHNDRDLRILSESMVHAWPVIESLRELGYDIWRLEGIDALNADARVHDTLVYWLDRVPDGSAAKQLIVQGLVTPQ